MAKFTLLIEDQKDGSVKIDLKLDPEPGLGLKWTTAQTLGATVSNYIREILDGHEEEEVEDGQ